MPKLSDYNAFARLPFLSTFRICVALLAALPLISLGQDYSLFFSKQGLYAPSEIFIQSTSLATVQELAQHLNTAFGTSENSFYIGIALFYLGCCTSLLLGFISKINAAILLLLHASLFISVPAFTYGADCFLQLLLFYCLLFPVQRCYSVDQLLFGSKAVDPKLITAYQQILRFHLCLVYCFSGLAKAISPTWWNGDALEKALHLPYFQVNGYFTFFLQHLPKTGYLVCGIAVLLLECSYPLCWFKALRKPIVYLMLALHAGIALFMGLYVFAATMIGFNYCAWFTDNYQICTTININKQWKQFWKRYKPRYAFTASLRNRKN